MGRPGELPNRSLTYQPNALNTLFARFYGALANGMETITTGHFYWLAVGIALLSVRPG